MTSLLVIAITIAIVAAVTATASRLAAGDGGRRRGPLRRVEDDWWPGVPTRPYSGTR